MNKKPMARSRHEDPLDSSNTGNSIDSGNALPQSEQTQPAQDGHAPMNLHDERWQNALKAYEDGQLNWWTRQTVRRHLQTCADCREEVEAMRKFTNRLRAGDAGTLSPDLRARILAAMPAPAPLTKAQQRQRAQRPLILWGAAASATVLYFALYPAITASRRPSAEATKSVNMAGLAYTQDYDESYKKQTASAASAPGANYLAKQSNGGNDTGGTYAGAGRSAPTSNTPAPAPLVMGNAAAADKPAGADREGHADAANSATLPPALAKTPQVMEQDGARNAPANRAPAASAVSRPSFRAARPAGSSVADDETTRKVHKTADITVEVGKVEETSEVVEQTVKTSGGYVANNELTTGDDNAKTATLSVKVPVVRFEAFLNQMAHLGEVKAKNITGEDITDKTSDQVTEERSLQDEIGMTQAKLKEPTSKRERAENLETLRQLRVKAKQAQARLDNLRKLGTLADVTVTLNEKPKPVPPPPAHGGFLDEMKDTLHEAARSLVQAAKMPVVMLIWLVAYTPVWLLLFLGYRYALVWRRGYAELSENAPGDTELSHSQA